MRKEHFRRKVMKNCSKNYNWSLKCYLIIFISKGTIIGVKKEVNCMNIQKFTQKSIEAINNCEKIAYDYGNQEIDQEHFLYSLMTIEDSLIANLIEKMNIDKDIFLKNIEQLLNQKNKVSGDVKLYISNDLNKVLVNAEDYKLAGSNMEQYMKLDNFNNLQSQDTVKFVVSSEEDLKRALEIIRQYNLTEKCYVYFSPVFGKIEPVTIVDFMKDNLINGARVQLQLHKFIWSPDKKGV